KFKTDVLNARRSRRSSAQAALSSSKGGGYGFAEKIADGMTLHIQTINLLLETHGGGRQLRGTTWKFLLHLWGSTRCLQDYIQTLEKLSKAKFDSMSQQDKANPLATILSEDSYCVNIERNNRSKSNWFDNMDGNLKDGFYAKDLIG
ncbi:hypothetical protein Tco_1024504, partial [Tanacetum coccineum]